MDLNGNTVLITGGGSGIGRAIAEDLHARGNKVIIAGRRQHVLRSVVDANPGMDWIELDLSDPLSIADACTVVKLRHPTLNVIINNAGMMAHDDSGQCLDFQVMLQQVETNFLGPVQLTSALIGHLRDQPRATIVYCTSTLALAPLPFAAIYSATKAALHSYVQSQRAMLRQTNVTVREVAPNLVATALQGAPDPRAMPVDAFVERVIEALGAEVEYVTVEDPATSLITWLSPRIPRLHLVGDGDWRSIHGAVPAR